MADTEKIIIDKVIKGLECCRIDENRYINCADCPYYTDDDKGQMWCSNEINNDALELLKELKGLTLALEQANATINYLNEEKEKAIKEIEERKAFNLRCEGKPGWLMKGIDVGFNTALDILKDKDGE